MASIRKRDDGKWRARYRDSNGREHARHFARKVDAQRWLDEVTASVVTGQYVDPKAGRITFRDYAEQWRGAQVHRPASQAHVETMLRRHAYPTLGERPLASILPSEIQSWVKRISTDSTDRKALAPSTVSVVHSIVPSVMKAAVRGQRLIANPCDGTRLPKVSRKRVVPLETATVQALYAAMPEDLRALIAVAAGSGLRQGELFGLTWDRVNFYAPRTRRRPTTRDGVE